MWSSVAMPPGAPVHAGPPACQRRAPSARSLPCPSPQVSQQPNTWPTCSTAPRRHASSPCPHTPSRSSVKAHARGRPSKTPKPPQEASPPQGGWDAALSGVPLVDAPPKPITPLPLDNEDLILEDGFEDDDDPLALEGFIVDEDEIEEDEEVETEDYDDEDDDEFEEEDEDYDAIDLDQIRQTAVAAAPSSDDPGPPPPGSRTVVVETLTYEEAMQETLALNKGATQPLIEVLTKAEAQRREDEAAGPKPEAVALPEGAQLALDRQGFQAFIMDPLEFLVGETADGRLDLQDSYVYDAATGVYARPEVVGKLPKGPVTLQVIPWVERRSADMYKKKEAIAKMKKVYFIGVSSQEPFRLALDQVFCFDSKTRKLVRENVLVAPGIRDPVLRIKASGITIEDSEQAPPPYLVAQQREEMMSAEEKEARLQERIEELESQAEELDRLDEAPDVSAADMM